MLEWGGKGMAEGAPGTASDAARPGALVARCA